MTIEKLPTDGILVWIFHGQNRVGALTRDRDGGNLPIKYGPWNRFRNVTLRRDQPYDAEAIEAIERDEIHTWRAVD